MLSRASHALRRAVASSGTAGATAHSLIPRRLLVASAPSSAVADKAMGAVRHDWTNAEVEALYDRPLLDLVYDAASVHRANHDPRQVQQCTLLSIKTGGCPETCNYCAQSSSWKEDTGLKAEKLMGAEDVLAAARRAKEAGSTRFCMGTAWRGPSQVGKGQFDRVLGMVSEVRDMGMEVCATLGMLDHTQARQLREAGLTAYNHNVDTSPEYYPKGDDFEKLRRSAEHDRRGEGGGDQRLLRRDLGPRRRGEGPREHAARPRQLTGAPGERADQRARPRQGYAAREPRAAVRVGDGPSHRRGANRDAPDSRPAQRGAHHHVPGRPSPRVPRGRQLGVHRR